MSTTAHHSGFAPSASVRRPLFECREGYGEFALEAASTISPAHAGADGGRSFSSATYRQGTVVGANRRGPGTTPELRDLTAVDRPTA
jgi:hypothetical protein